MNAAFKRLKMACYTTNISMAIVANLSPVLFLTFRSLYGISFSLLGLLVLINFFTQLTIDLIFSFFSHKFNIPATVKLTPVLTAAGLLIYALWPFFFPQAVYAGLVIGTVIFSMSGGLAEVLISPVIAAIPADNPDKEMSKLHSIYAWGVVLVILITTLFLFLFGNQNWQWIALLFMLIPLASAALFAGSKIPEMEKPKRISGVFQFLKNKGLWACFFAIFLGGASESIMSQWSSGYLEQALGIPKIWGDVFGVALFALMLGTGRTLYSKTGKNIGRVLLLGAVGATLCYLIAAISNVPVIGLIACAFSGFCVSMLWPGNLIVASDRFPAGGIFIYAMMAAGGDLGGAVGPQLVGVITDTAIQNSSAIALAHTLGLSPEQFGMKLGMLVGMLFPLFAIPLYAHIKKTRNRKKQIQNTKT